jgi:hypothetical protein
MDYLYLTLLLCQLPESMLFGKAHVVLEDGNLSDSTIDYCLAQLTDDDRTTYVILKLLKMIPAELRERPEPVITCEDDNA